MSEEIKTADEDNSKERYYDDVIAPELNRIGSLCESMGIPFLAVAEYGVGEDGIGEYGQTVAIPAGASLSFRTLDMLVRSRGNFDAFCIAVGRAVNSSNLPHSSVVLKMLGVNPVVAERK